MLFYRLPFPPSVNGLFLNVPRRGRVKTGRYKKWIKEATSRLKEQGIKTLHGIVSMRILLFRPDKRVRDIDNHVKAVFDILTTNGIIEDDSMVQGFQIYWSTGVVEDGQCWVEIKAWSA